MNEEQTLDKRITIMCSRIENGGMDSVDGKEAIDLLEEIREVLSQNNG
jgi:hypothetical protein